MIKQTDLTLSELKSYRIKLCRDAASFKKPDRIPHISFYITWPILDSGYKLSEALYDWDIMEKVMKEHQERYNFDAIQCLGTRNPMKITEALGVQKYLVNDEEGILSIQDEKYLDVEDLKYLINDRLRISWEKIMPLKYPAFKAGISVDLFNDAFKEMKAWRDFSARMPKVMSDEYGLPPINSAKHGGCSPGIDLLYQRHLGIKGLSLAMRRNPSLVKEVSDSLDEIAFTNTINALDSSEIGPDLEACFDALVLSMAQTLATNKQFEYFMWNDRLKPYLDKLSEKKKQARVYFHGALDRFYDYFSDYSKGALSMMVENNDVYEVKAKLPNVSICGGLTTVFMGHDSPEECVKKVKQLVDDLGSEGGLVLCLNTMGSYAKDTKGENLKAVSEFIKSYEF